MTTDFSKGLEGVVAGATSVSIIDEQAGGLQYRGYPLDELTNSVTFDGVAYLLLHDDLPKPAELAAYRKTLKGLRGLPAALKGCLELLPKSTHPMDVLRTGCSVLGCLEPEGTGRTQRDVANRL